MSKILINFAHPARARSKINNALRTAVEGLEDVTINDLYAHYPDFLIDVKREQRLCENHDVIIFLPAITSCIVVKKLRINSFFWLSNSG